MEEVVGVSEVWGEVAMAWALGEACGSAFMAGLRSEPLRVFIAVGGVMTGVCTRGDWDVVSGRRGRSNIGGGREVLGKGGKPRSSGEEKAPGVPGVNTWRVAMWPSSGVRGATRGWSCGRLFLFRIAAGVYDVSLKLAAPVVEHDDLVMVRCCNHDVRPHEAGR